MLTAGSKYDLSIQCDNTFEGWEDASYAASKAAVERKLTHRHRLRLARKKIAPVFRDKSFFQTVSEGSRRSAALEYYKTVHGKLSSVLMSLLSGGTFCYEPLSFVLNKLKHATNLRILANRWIPFERDSSCVIPFQFAIKTITEHYCMMVLSEVNDALTVAHIDKFRSFMRIHSAITDSQFREWWFKIRDENLNVRKNIMASITALKLLADWPDSVEHPIEKLLKEI